MLPLPFASSEREGLDRSPPPLVSSTTSQSVVIVAGTLLPAAALLATFCLPVIMS